MSNVPILLAIVLISLVTISKSQQIQSNSWVDQQEQNFNKLFAKLDQLETKVRDQELALKISSLEITSLKKQVQRLESLLHLQNVKDNVLEKEPVPAVSYSPRTCHEARESGLPEFKESGMYWIDPDGVGFGDSSIYVYCDMKTGATLVGHDSELTTPIPICNDAGCYKRIITYPNATNAQIQMLAELSTECQQSIRINCISMALENYAWWVDKNGKKQIFWSGSTEDVHTCDCGIQGNCVQENLYCNCDSNVAVQLSDTGVIDLKSILPVKELAFGGVGRTGGSHTLGKLECSGKTPFSPLIALSCRDLWLAGHILNGLYPIQKDKKVEFVYCDFSQGIYVEDVRIGYVDVKSEPVHFTVQKKTNSTEGAITFETPALDNEGDYMDLSTGIFSAPVPGTYVFDFSGLDLVGGNEVVVDLYKNDEVIGSFYASNHGALTIPTVLNLSKDDKIKLTVANNGILFGDTVKQLTHFTGFLLEEDVFIEP